MKTFFAIAAIILPDSRGPSAIVYLAFGESSTVVLLNKTEPTVLHKLIFYFLFSLPKRQSKEHVHSAGVGTRLTLEWLDAIPRPVNDADWLPRAPATCATVT